MAAPATQVEWGHVKRSGLRILLAGLLAAAALLPAGCETGRQSASREPAGFERPDAVEVDGPNSVVSFAGGDRFAMRRQALSAPNRYTEVLSFQGGLLRYERLFAAAYARAVNRDILQAILRDDFYRSQGISIEGQVTKSGSNAYGPFDYLVLDGRDVRCFVFGQFFGGVERGRMGSPGDQEFRGVHCRRLDDPAAANLENEMLELVSKVRFYRGLDERDRNTGFRSA